MNSNIVNLKELFTEIVKDLNNVVNPGTSEPFIFKPINSKVSEPQFKTALSTKPCCSMNTKPTIPINAIFNLKTEESVPVLDENGQPMMVKGEKGEMRVLRRNVKLDKPVLATKVFFDDGTWTVVKNSGEDEIEIIESELEDGNVVLTASTVSKERAIAYAIVKRIFGTVDSKTNEVRGADLNSLFDKVLAASIDQGINCAMSKAKKKKAKAERKTQMKFADVVQKASIPVKEPEKKDEKSDLNLFKDMDIPQSLNIGKIDDIMELLKDYMPNIQDLARKISKTNNKKAKKT